MRRLFSKKAEAVDLLYTDNDDWIYVRNNREMTDGYIWWEIIDSPIGYTDWVVIEYLAHREGP